MAPQSDDLEAKCGSESLQRFNPAPFADSVRKLSVRSPLRWLMAVTLNWGIILGAAMAVIASDCWPLYPLAVLIIATRQHALGACVHDAAHFLAFANRRLNDAASDLLCAFPLGMCTSTYRGQHFKHHRFLNQRGDPDTALIDGDPDWTWPKTTRDCIGVLLRDMSGLNSRMILIQVKRWSPYPLFFSAKLDGQTRLLLLLWIGFVIFVLTVIPHLWLWLIVFWLLP